ncbi:uncharacterized protein N7483_010117 [Penicillium malachiteum]|uniref:uncharacterized protein n=1 Tax=Penicillium malachiteum TaxID=1324776 RepID=UPI002548A278|nr:uncharacterized protein N7483_010117 [Penicillium malachiteum]KAJ5712936.1 hypothetical protein N7483_010117 [Penicillium malachiteum]
MRKPSIAQLVYNSTFPQPRQNDPGSFAAHVTRNLVPEVRLETNRFYGPLDCIEAQYPGLDYSSAPHRMRLGRFHWHKRLFRTFDALGLTREEILDLCCWEGTKSARTRHELEEDIIVRDTTGDSIQLAAPTPLPSVTVHDDFCGPEEEQDQSMETGSDGTVRASDTRSSSVMSDYPPNQYDEDYSDEEMESCGVALNHRLLAAMAARDQGADVPLDEDYEQWLKEAGERGGYGDMVNAIRSNAPLGFIPAVPTSALRHEQTGFDEGPLATTLSAEAFLYTTSNLFASSPVISQTNNTSGTAR